MSFSDLLKQLYFNPETGFISAQKLYKKAKDIDSSITLKQVREWYANQSEVQQFQEKRTKLDTFKISSQNPNSWQIDLAFWKKAVLLTAININSRIGYAKLLENKRSSTVLVALKDFTKSHEVDIITSDNGKEFMNDQVQRFFKENGIEHFNNEAGDHTTLGKIERFNRTLKQRLTKIDKTLTKKLLSDVIRNYNNTEHSSIKATPMEMKGEIIRSELNHNQHVMDVISDNFNIGDNVRYKLAQKTFSKESAKWSKTVYQIVGTDGYKLHLRSKNNHVLYKSPNDLKIVQAQSSDAPIKNNQIWEIEKILSHEKLRNGKFKYQIKWVGFDEPTWEPQANLRLINKSQMSQIEKEYFSSIHN